jgi:hypothetical protein
MRKHAFENSPAFEGWENRVLAIMSPVRDGSIFLSSPQGLRTCTLLNPSVKTLGYFRGQFLQNPAA